MTKEVSRSKGSRKFSKAPCRFQADFKLPRLIVFENHCVPSEPAVLLSFANAYHEYVGDFRACKVSQSLPIAKTVSTARGCDRGIREISGSRSAWSKRDPGELEKNAKFFRGPRPIARHQESSPAIRKICCPPLISAITLKHRHRFWPCKFSSLLGHSGPRWTSKRFRKNRGKKGGGKRERGIAGEEVGPESES